MSKRTPEELKQLRIDSLKKARAAKKSGLAPGHKSVDPPILQCDEVKMAASKSDVPHEFIGISKSDCCADCTAERCVISGRPVCAHPMKGGLQPVHMTDGAAVERYNRVRKHLAHVELDRRQ